MESPLLKSMKAINVVSDILITVVIVIASLLIVSVLPIPGNIKSYVVLSGSMEPSIKTGSVVFIKPDSLYKKGDVITFGSGTKTQAPVTHRIIETKIVNGTQVYSTKGDANNAADMRDIPKSEIQGKVFLTIPFLGYLVNFAKTRNGFLLLIIIPAVWIIIEHIIKIAKELSSKNKDIGQQKEKQENEKSDSQ